MGNLDKRKSRLTALGHDRKCYLGMTNGFMFFRLVFREKYQEIMRMRKITRFD